MDFDQLSDLNKDFAKKSAEFYEEFINVFEKHLKTDLRLTIICSMQMPVNLVLNLIEHLPAGLLAQAIPELPDMMERHLRPFTLLKDRWGVLSGEEFAKEYGKLYAQQFTSWFPSKEEKDAFDEWWKGQKKDPK